MKKFFLLAAASIALAACNNEDPNIEEPVAALIYATIGNSAVTRASGTSWTEGDAIGISMNDGRYNNVKYVAGGANGSFSGNTTIYFKNKRDNVTLTAYYPFTGEEGTDAGVITKNISAADQTSDEQPKFDFLFAKAEDVKGENPEVKFSFAHKMSKLTILFKNGKGMEVSNLKSYSIEGLVWDGTFDTRTGACTAGTEANASTLTIDLTNAEVKEGTLTQSLIIFPQALASDESVTLKLSDLEDQDFTCTLNFSGNQIHSGDNYLFNITVNKTALSVTESNITDWAPAESQDASADSDLSVLKKNQ